jgi:hypothetical protein
MRNLLLVTQFIFFVITSTGNLTFLGYFPYIETNKNRFIQSPCCLCICLRYLSPLAYHLLNAGTNLYETRYVCHGI